MAGVVVPFVVERQRQFPVAHARRARRHVAGLRVLSQSVAVRNSLEGALKAGADVGARFISRLTG